MFVDLVSEIMQQTLSEETEMDNEANNMAVTLEDKMVVSIDA